MRKNLIVICLLLSTSALCVSSTKAAHWLQTDKVQKFINSVAHGNIHKHHKISLYLSQATIQDSIIKKISKPYESQPWNKYKKHFLNKSRILQGKKFITQHAKVLNYAERKYGVSKYIITAIIGIESNYGQHMSDYKALDALTTLAFFYPKREKFFQYELREYLKLIQKNNWHPLKLESSYAGALGMPQFMPSNYNKLAVAYKGSSPDIFNNYNDVILSVANYLNHFNWRHYKKSVQLAYLSKSSPLRKQTKWPMNISNKQLAGLGIKRDKNLPEKIKILRLHGQKNNQVWLAYPNLDAILHYNPSPAYAITVVMLANKYKR